MIIRPARETDLQQINDIYNESVRTSIFAFDTQEKTLEERRAWFAAHEPPCSVLVGELEDGIAGWGSIGLWAPHGAYAATAEHSVFVSERHRGRGIGKALLAALVAEAEAAGFHVLVGRITVGNTVSRRLHEAFGFENVGTMREVGFKFGRLLDVWLMQKTFPRAFAK